MFAHGLALLEAGHEVQIFLLGEATNLMRKATADSTTPVGWPPISEFRDKIVARKIPVFACGAVFAGARGYRGGFGDMECQVRQPGDLRLPMVEWADRIITE